MIIRQGENKMTISFDEKFNQIVSSLNDTNVPDYPREDSNTHVDFIELLAMTSGEDGLSLGDIQDRFFGETTEDDSAEKKDANESFIKILFSIINIRIIQYGELYPFAIDDNNTILLKNNLSTNQKLYLFLLVSSSLDFFKPFMTDLTSDFEKMVYEALGNFLPSAEVKSFGKNSEYSGTAVEKIKKLAIDIGLNVNEPELNQVNKRNVQERGLDVVCWLPFADNCQNKIVILCQCACGKNYEYKQHETHRFANYFSFYKVKPRHSLCVPFSLINPQDGKFYHSDYIEEDCLVFERLRLLNLTRMNNSFYDKMNSKKIVERCIHTFLKD